MYHSCDVKTEKRLSDFEKEETLLVSALLVSCFSTAANNQIE